MSIEVLENFVSVLVRGSSDNAQNHIVDRPRWWPEKVPFRYPVVNKNKNDLITWRNTLLMLVLKCFQHGGEHRNVQRNQLELKYRNISKLPSKISNKICDTNSSNVYNLNSRLPPSFSPRVVLNDIFDTSCNAEFSKEVERAKKDNYFSYLNLNNGSEKRCENITPVSTVRANLYKIPLTSNLGLKIMKTRRRCRITQKQFTRSQKLIDKYCAVKKKNGTKKKLNKIVAQENVTNKRSDRIRKKGWLEYSLLLQQCRPCYVLLNNIGFKMRHVPTKPKMINTEQNIVDVDCEQLKMQPIVKLEKLHL